MLDALIERKPGGHELSKPSVSYNADNLYMHGPLEADTRPNLSKVPSLSSSSYPPWLSCLA